VNVVRAQDNISKAIEYTKQIIREKVVTFWYADLRNAISNLGNKRAALEYFLYSLEVQQNYGSDKTSVKFLKVLDQFKCGLGDS